MKNYEEALNLIERTDRLIRLQATGTAKELALTLGISRISVCRLFKDLRDMGAPVKYNRNRRTYYYEYPIEIIITCKIVIL